MGEIARPDEPFGRASFLAITKSQILYLKCLLPAIFKRRVFVHIRRVYG
jgi:hypothetical protein